MNTERRFRSPGILTEDSLVLGISVKRWNQAFTGSFEKSLAGVKRRVDQIESVRQLPIETAQLSVSFQLGRQNQMSVKNMKDKDE